MGRPRTRLVLGLGNPGSEYEGTRHNVGFELVDRVARALGVGFHAQGRSLVASTAVVRDGGESVAVLLAKPTTYMNNSGRAARDLAAEVEGRLDVLVACDDFHLPLGRMRARAKGSAGGQNGLASVIEHLAGQDVARLRLGIGDPGRAPAEEFVLRPFKRAEEADVADMLDRAAAHLADWLVDGSMERLQQAVNAA